MTNPPLTTEDVASVVVIDDTPDLRMLLRMVLELSDRYQVVGEAGDGASGVEIVREVQPDLVLLDLAMPIMDGLEALPLIRAVCPTTTVVVLSGFEADRMADQAIERGAAAYVQKGTRPDDIVGTLDAILKRPVDGGPTTRVDLDAGRVEPSELDKLRTAVATAAHELRTPATVLIGLATALSRKRAVLDQRRIDELLDAIIRQARVLDRVTSDLLTSSYASRGGLTADVERMDLTPALYAATLSVAELTDVAVDCPLSVLVQADPVRVQQMLTNLLSNALKHAAPPISVSVAVDDHHAVVRVDDSGNGVAEEFRPHLFEQYSRAPGSHAAGSGLGLFVVRALAEAQRGRAWYEPRPGIGSSFSFSLPLG